MTKYLVWGNVRSANAVSHDPSRLVGTDTSELRVTYVGLCLGAGQEGRPRGESQPSSASTSAAWSPTR